MSTRIEMCDNRYMPEILLGDNLPILKGMQSGYFDLIYVDPPFNTQKKQTRTQIKTVRSEEGDRVGYQGNTYKTIKIGKKVYADQFSDYIGFLKPRMIQAHRILKPTGSLFLHLDYREVHYAKVMMDEIFGRECFMNEIIWSYDYGARSKTKWPTKHDNILWYVNDPKKYTFNYKDMDRIPYLAPGLVTVEKAKKGKTPTDCWWHTIVPTNGREKTGYPTQKPLGIIRRIVRVHSNPGDKLLDFFAGSGTLGEAALQLGRQCTLIDNNPDAVEIMRKRFYSS
jgi:site-specific DNA-methyltransferase (adenine-specific)